MKLYYMPGACSLASHIVLEWIGAPYDAVRTSRPEMKSEEYGRINPERLVPALVLDDGSVITQCVAVLNYLADSFPQAGLGGDGSPKSRAEINRWLATINADIHPTAGELFRIHPAFRAIFPDHDYFRDAAVMADLTRTWQQRLGALLRLLDTQLAGQEWLAGARSIADPYLFVIAGWTRMLDFDISSYANIRRHTRQLAADPAVQRVLAAEGLPTAA